MKSKNTMPLPVIPQPVRAEELPGQSNAEVITAGNADPALGTEGYELHITPTSVTLHANAPAGFFYGQQTLRQLRAADGSLPCCRIWDKPRFGWRGLMVDVARHFFTKDEIKHFLDVMAAHKLNVFHWHLVDDQGWRIEIKRYPKLTELAAWRNSIGFGLDPGASRNYRADGRYGGFYTQAEIREIVAHAASQHITIVPEIEMPGHSSAALTAHGELTCSGNPCTTNQDGGIFHGIFCAGKEAPFEFLQNILTEVIELFPGQYIHIGGDEVPKDNWKKCPHCQQRMRNEGLQNEEELQSYFIRRVEKFINAQGRRLIGWDEILEGGLAPNATVMSWRGVAGGIAAATAGHDVVMTPFTHCYFDFYQGKVGQPKAIGGYIPLEKVYEFEPVVPEIPAEKTHHVLGGGANLWTEYMPNYGHLQYMTYPRACALAEVLWSPKESRDFAGFQTRLARHTKLLDALGVKYARTLD
ncbi:MAG: Beta-hexosaminidase [Verrucomicrobiae bacterium]|nr:Beta-hexosaminidase [Verrucomicrobiae bacterium]